MSRRLLSLLGAALLLLAPGCAGVRPSAPLPGSSVLEHVVAP